MLKKLLFITVIIFSFCIIPFTSSEEVSASSLAKTTSFNTNTTSNYNLILDQKFTWHTAGGGGGSGHFGSIGTPGDWGNVSNPGYRHWW